MKKLNRKGFTLIELLAVIVIMAIILIVTVPNIIQSINDARIKSLHNLAVNVANTYNTLYAQNLLASNKNKSLSYYYNKIARTQEWICIANLDSDAAWSVDEKLSEILGLNSTDIVLTKTTYVDTTNQLTDEKLKIKEDGTSDVVQNTCSAIRIKNGDVEVVLVAAKGGRFYVAQNVTYAHSKDTEAKQNPVD